MKEVDWHHLNSECPVTEVLQFWVVPKGPQACQFLNQHNIPISEVISYNTNLSIGDASCVYYNFCIKLKAHKKKRNACQRVCAQVGWDVLRAAHEKQKCKQLTEQNDSDDQNNNNKMSEELDKLSKEIEGLGIIFKGTYAICSHDTVRSTLVNILIMQDGEHFIYWHNFMPFLIS